jgi:hypothetical protein
MGEAGSTGGAFHRACDRGNVVLALAAVADMRKPLTLEYALMLTSCFARAHDVRFEPAAVRFIARLIEERALTLTGLRLAAEAISVLPDESAERMLRELVRRR